MIGDFLGTLLVAVIVAGTIGLFGFLAAAWWVRLKAEERLESERYVLLRKVAESPADVQKALLDALRAEDDRQEVRRRERLKRAAQRQMQSGAVLVAVGLGLAIFFGFATLLPQLWAVGAIPVFIGIAVMWSSRSRSSEIVTTSK